MNNNKYLLFYCTNQTANQTKVVFFENLADARIYANGLPESASKLAIYELFETYEEEEKEEKEVNNEEEKLDFNCFFQELNKPMK